MTQTEVQPRSDSPADPDLLGRGIFGVLAGLFGAMSLAVVLRGAPLADDFHNCLEPHRVGLLSFLADSAQRLGAIRPARFLEIFITNGICQYLPFGFAIAVPLILTLVVAWLLRGLLRDLGTPSPWPEVAAAVWLVQPLGTESALWPAALHVPLGLSFALAAVRLHRSGRHGWGVAAVVGACLSVEQAVLALPLAVWLASPPSHRRRALVATLVPVILVLVSFVVWAGDDARLQASVGERLAGLLEDPAFYMQFPAVGLGVHSIPLAVLWSFPIGVAVLGIGAFLGGRLGPHLFRATGATDRRAVRSVLVAGVALIALVNIPVVVAVPRGGSPRLFTPTWLVLSAIVGLIGPRLVVRRRALVGAISGTLVAGALLSIGLSIHVRLRSADFGEASVRRLAAQVPEGGVVAVCRVRRTVVEPAPRGAFALHEYMSRWSAQGAMEYYTGRRARFIVVGPYWSRPCPQPDAVDLLVSFPRLLAETQP
jgi:hypothetical protein